MPDNKLKNSSQFHSKSEVRISTFVLILSLLVIVIASQSPLFVNLLESIDLGISDRIVFSNMEKPLSYDPSLVNAYIASEFGVITALAVWPIVILYFLKLHADTIKRSSGAKSEDFLSRQYQVIQFFLGACLLMFAHRVYTLADRLDGVDINIFDYFELPFLFHGIGFVLSLMIIFFIEYKIQNYNWESINATAPHS